MSGAPLQIGLLGVPARLAEPRALWLLLAVALLGALGAWALLRRRALLERAAGPQAARLAPAANLARPAGRLALALAGLALLVLALARPQAGSRTELARRAGIDLVVVLDTSRSMLARDVPPDRLTRARLEVGALLDQLRGDRVAIVVFAAEAFVLCPLTSDAEAARLFLRSASAESVPQQGTDLGNALQGAQEVLEGAGSGGARSRAVLVVSDGEDQEGGAVEAARRLAEAGTRVFALAVGGTAGEPIPLVDAAGRVTGFKKDRAGQAVVTRLDAATLRAVAQAGGGELYELGSPDRGLPAFLEVLGQLEKSELESRVTVRFEDRFALAAWPALGCLLLALLLPEGRRRRAGDGEGA